jgi:tetratricopeptide (TPR) repeat protein
LAQNDFEKAHEALDFSLAIDENNVEALETRGYCFVQTECYEEALEILRNLLPNSKAPSRIYALISRCYLALEMLTEVKATCLEWLQKCTKQTGFEKAEIFNYISMCCSNLHQPEEGMQYIDAALNLEPSFRRAILQKGMLYL